MDNVTLFIDESGDLGNKNGSSKHFVITILLCHTQLSVNIFYKAVKRTIRNKLSPNVAELKGVFTDFSIKKYFYHLLPPNDWSLFSIILVKNRAFSYVQTRSDREKLYNQLVEYLLQNINFPLTVKGVHLIFDKCKNSLEKSRFNPRIETQLQLLLPKGIKLYIDHLDSYANPGLQAVDLFSWGIHRKFKKNDLEWYTLFKEHIKFEYECKIRKTAPLIPIS